MAFFPYRGFVDGQFAVLIVKIHKGLSSLQAAKVTAKVPRIRALHAARNVRNKRTIEADVITAHSKAMAQPLSSQLSLILHAYMCNWMYLKPVVGVFSFYWKERVCISIKFLISAQTMQ